MGTHGRLGAGADAHCSVLAAEPGLVGMIVGMCCGSGRVGGEGLLQLLGGGLLKHSAHVPSVSAPPARIRAMAAPVSAVSGHHHHTHTLAPVRCQHPTLEGEACPRCGVM